MAVVKGVKIEGLEELRETLEKTMPREAKNILRRTKLKIASTLRNEIREKAPVYTGNLRRSIKSKRDRGTPTNITASVYVDKSGGRSGKGYHWHLVEFGARGGKMPAQPFVVPTVESFRPKVDEMYRAEFGVQFEREMAKRNKKR